MDLEFEGNDQKNQQVLDYAEGAGMFSQEGMQIQISILSDELMKTVHLLDESFFELRPIVLE
jgi:hypothetical protein